MERMEERMCDHEAFKKVRRVAHAHQGGTSCWQMRVILRYPG